MTARFRAGSRPVEDARLTPIEVARACVGLLQLPIAGRVFEPSAGDGAWVRALVEESGARMLVLDVVANELRAECRPRLYEAMMGLESGHLAGSGVGFEHALPSIRRQVYIGRFEDFLIRPKGGYDLVVGNPPFSLAETHLRHALYLVGQDGMVAFLLGVTFRSSMGRRALFRDARWGLWRKYLLEERPSFSGDGATDATEYALFVFRRGYTGDSVERSFSWKDPVRYAADRKQIITADWR